MRPQYDLKQAKIYETMKEANTLASEVKCRFYYLIPYIKVHIGAKLKIFGTSLQYILISHVL